MFRRQIICIGILAAASLLLESTLTRLLAVTQFYHFAFLVVSLALLGYGASGTLLAVSPKLRKLPLEHILIGSCVGFVLSVGIAFWIVNFLPFDSYAISWDRRQLFYFGIYYLVLAVPFLMSGVAAGAGIQAFKGRRHQVYAANLLGSGIGAVLAPPGLWLSGVPGAFLLCGLLGMAAMMPVMVDKPRRLILGRSFKGLAVLVTIFGLGAWGILIQMNLKGLSPLVLTLSDYKGFAQALRTPDAEVLFSRWNAISRVDVIQGAGTHTLPGLSYVYSGEIPNQVGMSLDAGALQPVTLVSSEGFEAGNYLPEYVVFRLRPGGSTLVLEPGGGLGVLQALSGGNGPITAVLSNPLEAAAVQAASGELNAYMNPRVQMIFDSSRVFLQQETQQYDIVMVPLTDTFRPVASGAYSLAEENLITINGMTALLSRLSSDGILVMTRWLQTPPSESLRASAAIVEALAGSSDDPGGKMILYRGIQTMTILVKPSGWTPTELALIRTFAKERKYDLVWSPDIQEWEPNRSNRLPAPGYFQAIRDMLASNNRGNWYSTHPFDIRPPTDNHPFFYHFFKWEQTSDILSSMGHVWQPFGGSGYLVTLALLVLTTLISLFLILLPLVKLGRSSPFEIKPVRRWLFFVYFSMLGFGFLFIEIPLIQESMLLFGHPITAFTVVVFTVLSSSSLGSAVARMKGNPGRVLMLGLVVVTAILTIVYPRLVEFCLGWPLLGRILLVILVLAPAGFLMGFPFPLGLAALDKSAPGLIPWVWGVNGSVSVVASVLAAILVLSFGFKSVLWLGTGMYAGAALLYGGALDTFKRTS